MFREVIQSAREMELEQTVWFAAYDFASMVGPHDPEARAAAEEVLATSRRNGWNGIVGMFEPLFAEEEAADGVSAPSGTPAEVIPAGGQG